MLDDRDVVVGVQADDLLRTGLAPVDHVVLGHLVGDVHIAGLPHRTTAAPLLIHQTELDATRAQEQSHRSWHRGAVEGGLAVREQDSLPTGRNVQAGRPRPHLAPRGLAGPSEHRLVTPTVGELGPSLPVLLMNAALHGERADRLDHVDGPLTEAIEVTGHQRVGAAKLAGPAHGAVDVVLGHVLDREMAFLHRDDVGVERGRAVALVPGDLHDRTDLAAELMPRAEAVVGDVAPLFKELRRQAVRLTIRLLLRGQFLAWGSLRHGSPLLLIWAR